MLGKARSRKAKTRKAKAGRAVVALALLVAALLAPAVAHAETYINGYLRYTVEDQSITIVRYAGREEEVRVPAMIAGNPVNTIASGAFTNCETVRTVYLPDCITSVEEGAFDVGQTVVYNYNQQSGAPATAGADAGAATAGAGGSGANEAGGSGSADANDTAQGQSPAATTPTPIGITLSNGTLLSVDDQGNLVWVDKSAVEYVLDGTKTYTRTMRDDGTLAIVDDQGNEVQVSDQNVVSFSQDDGTQVILDAASGTLSYQSADGSWSYEEAVVEDDPNSDQNDNRSAAQGDSQEAANKVGQGSSALVPILIGAAVACAAYLVARKLKK